MKAVFLGWMLVCLAGLPSWGQSGVNPFDLTPRLPATAPNPESSLAATGKSGNPFDIYHAATPLESKPKTSVKKERPSLTSEEKYKTFIFSVTVAALTLLTIFLTMFRPFILRAWRGLLNENMLNQVYRECQNSGAFPFYVLYGFFGLNAGVFLYLLTRHFQIPLPFGHWQSLAVLSGGVWALLAGKLLLLSLVGAVFPAEKEIGFYRFTLIIFGVLLGLMLVFANLLIAYGPSSLTRGAFITTFGILGIAYIFRSLRGLLIANNFLATNKFHFFLYLCSVELAPLLILVKWIQNQV